MLGKICSFIILALLIILPVKSNAGEFGSVDVSGFIGIETRIFTQNPRWEDQDSGAELSVIFNPEFHYQTQDCNHQFSFIPFYRKDSRDEARTHFDVREAYWLWIGDEWEVLTGINKVFWGTAESRHLVNIINQSDNVENLDGEDYLGQPMINIGTQRDWGRIDLYVLPGFRERTFSGSDGRFRAVVPVDTKNAIFESSVNEKHIDFATRYSHYFGDWDVGAFYFYGTGREPRLIANTNATKFIPNYDLIHQTGIDVQYTNDSWLWKFEGIAREGQGKAFIAAVGGFEYTFYQVFNTYSDIGVLAEYQYDGRTREAPFTASDQDLFTGIRWAANDIQDTQILGGFNIDTSTHEIFYNIEAQRRIGDNYDLELSARFFAGSSANEDVYAFERDDYIQIRFARYF
ncbi:MAG: hypothetical protein KAJ86_01960 [Alphaproteobacteria bacterium]|nr:hypothetical protein [Alphaproteobacteria bacterium]